VPPLRLGSCLLPVRQVLLLLLRVPHLWQRLHRPAERCSRSARRLLRHPTRRRETSLITVLPGVNTNNAPWPAHETVLGTRSDPILFSTIPLTTPAARLRSLQCLGAPAAPLCRPMIARPTPTPTAPHTAACKPSFELVPEALCGSAGPSIAFAKASAAVEKDSPFNPRFREAMDGRSAPLPAHAVRFLSALRRTRRAPFVEHRALHRCGRKGRRATRQPIPTDPDASAFESTGSVLLPAQHAPTRLLGPVLLGQLSHRRSRVLLPQPAQDGPAMTLADLPRLGRSNAASRMSDGTRVITGSSSP
jgi:hypothetical protein